VAEGSPTVRRRELGALLRRLREEQGMSVKQVTEHLLCSPSKVSRIETGQRGATLRDVRDLCDLYGVTDRAERDRLMTLAKEGKQQGWWQSYSLPYSTYVGLEAEATAVSGFHSSVMPGLLQTAEYAHAIQEAAAPEVSAPDLTPEIIEQRVEARIRRQALLTKETPLKFTTIVDEAVLHRLVGGSSTMRGQLQHLVSMAALPNVTIQVIPYGAGAHPALESTFYILDFADAVPSVIYVEGLVGWIYLERIEDIGRYRRVFERLGDLALSPAESVKFIAEIQKSYEGGLTAVS
jgi:transcriptional regulator with XRE-family HTH domain